METSTPGRKHFCRGFLWHSLQVCAWLCGATVRCHHLLQLSWLTLGRGGVCLTDVFSYLISVSPPYALSLLAAWVGRSLQIPCPFSWAYLGWQVWVLP